MGYKSTETIHPEYDRIVGAEEAFRSNIADLLGKLAHMVDLNLGNGSSYLAIRTISKDLESGLSQGFTVLTDRTFGNDTRAAYQQISRGHTYSYGMNTLNFLFVDELSPGNINIKELWLEKLNSGICHYTEEGHSNLSVDKAISGYHGWPFRVKMAAKHDVKPEDFLYYDGTPDANMVNGMFSDVLAPGGALETSRRITFPETYVMSDY